MDTTPPLLNKFAIVTGASRGIGAAIALNLARKGANLLLNHSSASSVPETSIVASQCLSINPAARVSIVQADLGTIDGPAKILEAVKTFFGDEKLQVDILINNAGVSGNQLLHEVTLESFDWQYNINVRGPLLLTQLLAPHLPTNRTGRIINLSSVSATLGFKAQSIYGGTKAALDAMTRTWARELSERCTVNSVNPGPVETRMYAGTTGFFQDNLRPFIQASPGMQVVNSIDDEEEEEEEEEEKNNNNNKKKKLYDADAMEAIKAAGGRSGKPEEVAGVVGMLVGPESGWCTGQVVCANGGMIFGTC